MNMKFKLYFLQKQEEKLLKIDYNMFMNSHSDNPYHITVIIRITTGC